MLKDILIGVAIAAVTGGGAMILRWAVVSQRLPKRIARLEAGMVMLLRHSIVHTDAVVAVIHVQQGHELNGELEEMLESVRTSKAAMSDFLAGSAISQKASR